MTADQIAFDAAVLAAIDPILAQVTPQALDAPTPCAEWRLRDLLAHMIGHHRGFAAATATDPAGKPAAPDPRVWDDVELGPDPYRTYRDAAQLVSRAFAGIDPTSSRLNVYGYGTFPATVALNMHSVDFLAHGWDVAMALGVTPNLPERLCEQGLAIARTWPDHPATWGPNGAFQAKLAVPAEASAATELMGMLGRTADWSASRQPD